MDLSGLFSSLDGGRGLQKTLAWREPCRLSSESFGLHHGSGTPQLRAGGTRGANGLCLSSSLHNRFITFYRKTPATSSVSPKKRVLSGLVNCQCASSARVQSHTSTHWQLTDSAAAEQAKGDLADDPVPRQGFRQHAHHKADHCDTAIEELCPLETLAANLSCCSALEPVFVGSGSSHRLLEDFEMLRLL